MKQIKILTIFLALVITPSIIISDEIPSDTKIPIGLAYDGTVLWIADAQTRELSGYDFQQKKALAPKTLTFDTRDLAWWAPNLITVAPNAILVINPINGNLVDKIPLKNINDPVAIAVDGHQAYIYNRTDKKIYRIHLVDRIQFGSFTPDVGADIRSLTFYKDFLWASAKDTKAYKLQHDDGTQVSFLPLPNNNYGIAFVNGGMYVARPGHVRSVDFIETENYVAAARKNYTFSGELQLIFPWDEKARITESRFALQYSMLPSNAHQRLFGLRSDPLYRYGRSDDGANSAEVTLEKNSAEKNRLYRIQFQTTLYNLTYIFNQAMVKAYFKNPELPESVRAYLNPIEMTVEDKAQIDSMKSEWHAKYDGKHPIYLISLAKRNQKLDDSTRCALFRSLAVPCRRMTFLDLDAQKQTEYLQVFLQPTGWVSITDAYSPEKLREFPISNNQLELFSMDDIKLTPKLLAPANKTSSRQIEIVKFPKMQIVSSSTE